MKLGTTGRRLSVVLLSASVVCGCASTPNSRYAERRFNERIQGMGRTLDAYAESEAKRPGNLARDFAFIGEDIANDARQFDRDLRWWDRQLHNEFARFAARQPDYWREAARIFGGKPERIERNAIDLFY